MKQNKTHWQNRVKAVALSGIMLAGCIVPALQSFDVSADAYTDAGVVGPTYSENLVVGGGTYENVLAESETSVTLGTTSETSVSGAWSYAGTPQVVIPTGAAITKDGDNTVLSTRTAKGWSYAAQSFDSQGVGDYLVSFDYYNPTGAVNGYLYFLYFNGDINWKTLEMYGDYDGSNEQNVYTATNWLGFNAGTAIEGKEGWYHFEQTIGIPRDGYSDICFASYAPNDTDRLDVDNVSVKFVYPREAYSENLIAGGGTFENVLTGNESTTAVGTTYTDPVSGVWSNTNWADSPAVISQDPTDSTNSVVKLSYTTGNHSHAIFNFNNKGVGKYLLEFDYYNGIANSGNIGRIWSNFGKSKATDVTDEEENVIGSIIDDAEGTWTNNRYDSTTWATDAPGKTWHVKTATLNLVSNPSYNIHSGNPIEGKTGWIHFKQYIELDNTLDWDILRIWAQVGTVSSNQVLIDNVSVRAVKPLCEDETYFDWTVNFGHSASFHNNLTMNYYVPASDLADYDSYYLSVEKAVWNEDGTWGTETARIDGTLTGDGYKFVFNGIAAAEAGNTLKATLYATADGKTYKSQVDTYSVKEYAYNRLAESDDQAFKTLLVNMLNYCAAAQTYFGVNAENLVNADLTAEQQALATANDATLQDTSSTVTLDGATVQIVGKSIVFNSNIEVKFYMDLSAYDDLTGITVSLSYTDVKGGTHVITKNADEFGTERGYYTVKVNELSAADLRQVFSVTVLKDGEAISDTVNYSVESYAYNRLANSENEDFKTLIKELMKYSDSAKAYFAA